MNQTTLKKTIDNTVTIANATDLVADIVLKISGNDVSNSLNGAIVKRPLICTMAQSVIRQKLSQNAS